MCHQTIPDRQRGVVLKSMGSGTRPMGSHADSVPHLLPCLCWAINFSPPQCPYLNNEDDSNNTFLTEMCKERNNVNLTALLRYQP